VASVSRLLSPASTSQTNLCLQPVEIIDYIGRALSAKESPNWTTGPYIMQSLLLLLAPALFAASIYMVLARVILLTDGESHSVIKVRWVTKILSRATSYPSSHKSAGALPSHSDPSELGRKLTGSKVVEC